MKTSITEQLMEQNLLVRSRKTYLDRGCSEYSRVDMDEKVKTLARMVREHYDLHAFIAEYQHDFEGSHTLSSLNDTLQGYIGHIRVGKVTDPITYVKFRNASLKEVIDALIESIEEKVLTGPLF